MSLSWVYLYQHFLEVFNHILVKQKIFAFFHCLFALNRNLAALDRAKGCHPCLPVRTRTNCTHGWCPSMPLSIWNIDVCLKNNEYLTFSLKILFLPALIGPIFFLMHHSTFLLLSCIFIFPALKENKCWQCPLYLQSGSLDIWPRCSHQQWMKRSTGFYILPFPFLFLSLHPYLSPFFITNKKPFNYKRKSAITCNKWEHRESLNLNVCNLSIWLFIM